MKIIKKKRPFCNLVECGRVYYSEKDGYAFIGTGLYCIVIDMVKYEKAYQELKAYANTYFLLEENKAYMNKCKEIIYDKDVVFDSCTYDNLDIVIGRRKVTNILRPNCISNTEYIHIFQSGKGVYLRKDMFDMFDTSKMTGIYVSGYKKPVVVQFKDFIVVMMPVLLNNDIFVPEDEYDKYDIYDTKRQILCTNK